MMHCGIHEGGLTTEAYNNDCALDLLLLVLVINIHIKNIFLGPQRQILDKSYYLGLLRYVNLSFF